MRGLVADGRGSSTAAFPTARRAVPRCSIAPREGRISPISAVNRMSWKPKHLHPRWRKWRSARRRELIGAGADPEQATRIAAAEARGRCNIARVVGHGAAINAELVVVRQGGQDRVFLKGALDEVPSAWRPRVTELTSQTMQSFAGRGSRRKAPGTD